MTKAVLFPLTFIFLLAAVAVAPAQNQNPAANTAVNEAVMRQANVILLRQKLDAARAAVEQKDLVSAAKLYEDAYDLVQKIGSGIDAEAAQTVSGLVAVRMELAREAERRGDLHEADTEILRVLKVAPNDPEAIAFKKHNDLLLAQMRGRVPDAATLEEAPAIENQKTEAATLARDGQMLYEMGKLEEAEKKLTDALNLDPDNHGAYYYLNLVKQARYAREEQHKNIDDGDRMVQVERAWESPVHRELLPTPNPYARTNLVHTGAGREEIYSKLDRIRLDNVSYKGLPLSEVIRDLTQQSQVRDPDKKGINFLFNPNTENISATGTATTPGGGGAPGQPTTINPATGLPQTAPSAGPEIADPTTININLTLNDVRLADVLDAVCLVADHPIKYSIEDYAVVFSARGPDSPQLEFREFKVDPNTFYSGLQNVSSFVFGAANLQSSGIGGGSSSSSSSSGGQNGQSVSGAVVPVVDMSPGAGAARASGGGGGGAGAGGGGGGNALVNPPFENNGGGVLYVTAPNQTRDVSSVAKLFFTSLGVNLDPPKSLFFNDRLGELFVYAAPQDLDIIERAIKALNDVPPQVHIKARFIDVEEDESKALGFDWYLGQISMGNVVGQGGSAPSLYNGSTGTGYFPGQTAANLLPGSLNNQLVSSGLNTAGIPTVATITGIMTDPNFRVVLHALETRTGTQELAEPEVTTLSGRQTQMRATQIITIVTGFNYQQGSGSGISTTGGGTP